MAAPAANKEEARKGARMFLVFINPSIRVCAYVRPFSGIPAGLRQHLLPLSIERNRKAAF